jgi:hypothetical protein
MPQATDQAADLGRLTDEPVAEIVQCGEPTFSMGYGVLRNYTIRPF